MPDILKTCPFYHSEDPCIFNKACQNCQYFTVFRKRQKILRWILLLLGAAFLITQIPGLW